MQEGCQLERPPSWEGPCGEHDAWKTLTQRRATCPELFLGPPGSLLTFRVPGIANLESLMPTGDPKLSEATGLTIVVHETRYFCKAFTDH